MDVLTHTKHDFIHRTPHTHTLLSRIRDFFSALRTAAIRGSSAATRASAPCSLLCCSQLSQLLSWARLPSPSARRHGCQPYLRLCCPSSACCTHALAEASLRACRSRCRPQMCEKMSLSPTAAAGAIVRPRSSSSRFVPTTFVACKHRGEAQGESRHATAELFEVRGGLRFDSRALRTLSSSKWMKSEAPTSLKTNLEVKSDLVAVPRAPSAPRRPHLSVLLLWPPQTSSDATGSPAPTARVSPSHRSWSAATTAREH